MAPQRNSNTMEGRLGLKFKNKALLTQALTHRSYLKGICDKSVLPNERLEFLGDQVLGLVVSDYLYRKFSERSEGELTRLKAVLVSEQVLEGMSKEIGLSDFILMSPEEDLAGGRSRPSILAGAFEALIGAIYLDRGLEAAKKFVVEKLEKIIEDVEKGKYKDYKSILQELLQERFKVAPTYQVVEEKGPDHDKTFIAQAIFRGKVLGEGKGKSKKEAEQSAAEKALQTFSGEGSDET